MRQKTRVKIKKKRNKWRIDDREDSYKSKRDRSTSEIFVNAINAKTRNANNVDLTCALHVGSDVSNARVVPGLVPFLSDIK